jgi:hypothetical protein
VLLFIVAVTVSCGTPSPSAPSGVKTCTVTTVSVLVKAGDTLTMNQLFDGKGTVSLGRTVAARNRPTVTYLASGTAAPMELTGPSCR